MQELDGGKNSGPMLVGIGASAGGIDALLRFFEAMPADSGLAFAVVLHTTPDHDNRLAEVLQTRTAMPVTQVTDAVRVGANSVYCIPPDRMVSLTGGQIRLNGSDAGENGHAPIDIFFRALAGAYRDKAIAVVLSGAGADGSLGLGRIREEGGVSIVQDPSEAEHGTMPRSAIETGYVDFILPVAQMPEKLVSLKENAQRITLPPPDAPPRSVEEESLRELLALLRARTRHDFMSYKRSTLLRRIERRLQVTECEDIRAYLEHIRRNPEELQGLLRDLLISVTNFFRDPAAFKRLQQDVLPKLFEGRGANDHIRVWVTGCATGEEAYSIAMLLAEHADALSSPPALQIFATDIDEDALSHGRQGLYTHTIAADVSPERLKRFFVKEGQYYRVKRELREMVLFAPHNILRDPPFSKLNLVSCRNLLIYINRNMQERILEIFHFALKPDGHLFLGSSESAEGLSDLFTPVNKKCRIFKRTDEGNGNFRAAPPPPVAGEWVPRPAVLPQVPQFAPRPEGVTYGELHYRILEAIAPPSVLVNSDYDIVHLSEHAGRYLRLSGGEPTRNLLKVAHPDLRLELRSLLISAAQGGDVTSGRVAVKLESTSHFVRIVVRPLAAAQEQQRQEQPAFMLVVFEDEAEAVSETRPVSETASAVGRRTSSLEPVIRQLETELERTRDQLRATVEEYETSTEELKASNEELQAMNEELRSASEELETGKEELQSVNEELTTLNTELREKVDEIGRSNSDLQNLMASTRIATLFLDRTTRLKRYTPSAQEIFNIIPGDVGRPLAHVTHKLDYASMVEDAERVLRDLQTVEREIISTDGRHYLARLLPYRATDDKINGVVLTFTDITERKAAENAVAEDLRATQVLRELAAQSIADGDAQVLYDKILDAAIALTNADASTIQLLDDETQELVMLSAKNMPPHMIEHFARVDANSATPCGEALAKGERTFVDFEAAGAEDPDGSIRMHLDAGIVSAQSTPLVSRAGKTIGIFSTHWRESRRPTERELRFLDLLARQAADLIEQHQVEEALRESREKLARELEDTERLQKVSSLLIEPENGEGLYEEILDAAIAIMSADFGSIQMYDDERNELRLLAWRNFHPESAEFWQTVSAEVGTTCGVALRHGKRVVVPDVRAPDAPVDGEGRRYYELSGIAAVQTTPLTTREGRLVGMISTHWREPHAPEERELRLFDILARQSADFIERRRVAEALRASEERLRLVVETAEDYAIMLMDAEGRYVSWNTGAERMFGYTEEEVLGRSAEIIFTPEDREAGVYEQEFRTAERDGRANDERWHMRKDGSRFYVSGVLASLRHGRGFAKIARDLTAQKRAQDELLHAWERLDKSVEERTVELAEANSTLKAEITRRRRSEQERVDLLRRIVTTQEDERRRISRELHDQLGQSLTALRLKLDGLKGEAGKRSKLQGRIGELAELTRRLDTDVEFLAWELRPTALDDLGLIVALSNYAQEWSNHFGVKVNFHSAGLGDARLAPLTETNLYRIAQETLNNVAKHASASSVDVLLERRGGDAVLIVEDNGLGFAPFGREADGGGRGMGLIGMRERAALVGGTVEVETKQDEGTTVFVRIPVRFGPADEPAEGDVEE